MAIGSSQLLSLAEQIHSSTVQIVKALRSQGAQDPSFETGGAPDLWQSKDSKVNTDKSALLDACTALTQLVEGPHAYHRLMMGLHSDLAVFQAACELKILDNVPLGKSIDVGTLAKKVVLDEDLLLRILRFMQTHRCLNEVQPKVFEHTAMSEVLVVDKEMRAALEIQLDESHKASALMADYCQANPFPQGSQDTCFAYKWNDPLYGWLEKNPEKAARFAVAMAGMAALDRDFSALSDWIKQTGKSSGTIVDVGGGNGHVSVSLATEFPGYKFIVQDIVEAMFAQGAAALSAQMKDRITFEKHDFFTPQPNRPEVDAWFLRSCLHNWGDNESIKILQVFAAALEANPKASVLINESIVPLKGEISLYDERKLRQVDIAMMVLLNAKQRSEEDWRDLVKKADPRLKITQIIRQQGTMAILEIKLSSEIRV